MNRIHVNCVVKHVCRVSARCLTKLTKASKNKWLNATSYYQKLGRDFEWRRKCKPKNVKTLQKCYWNMSAISRSSTFSMMLGRLYLVTMVILLLLFSGCFGCMTKMLLGFSLMGCRFFVQSLFSLAFEHSLHIALNYCVFPAGMDSFIDGFIVAFF